MIVSAYGPTVNAKDIQFFRDLIHDLECKYALNISLRKECQVLAEEKNLSPVTRTRREESAHCHYKIAEAHKETADKISKYLRKIPLE